MALSALAWSQVASAHMSHGLVMCALLVTAFLIATATASVRAGDLDVWAAIGRVALFLVVVPLASLAILIPRLAFIGSSSLHRGYDSLGRASDRPIATNGVWAAWPLAYGVAPGAYVGAVTLLAFPLAFRARAHRAIVWAFGGSFLLTWVLMLNAVVTAGWFRSLILKIPFGDVYLHNPGRMRYLSMIAIPVLGAVGLQGLGDRPMSAQTAKRAIGAGVALLLGVPLVLGATPYRFILLVVAMIAAVPMLLRLATARARWAAIAVVCVLGMELFASAIISNTYTGGTIFTGLEAGEHPNLIPQVLRYPDLPERDYLRPTAFVDILRRQPDRYMTWAQPAANFDKGYLFTQRPQDWPALAMERGTLFGIPDVLGYNPVQLPRYWTYIRATNHNPVFYNAAVINEPSLEDVRLTGTRYLIVPKGFEAVPAGRIVARADDYDLVQVYGWEPRVSVVPSWAVAADPAAALRAVLTPGFDPSRSVMLEQDPGIEMIAGGHAGTATYREVEPEDVRITVDAAEPSIVVIRNSFDPGWSATVDGVDAPVLPTDYLIQGVAVAAGHHEIRLVYRDPDIARGLAASTLVWLILLSAIPAAMWLERRRCARSRPDAAGP
jgi:hypothetical protein